MQEPGNNRPPQTNRPPMQTTGNEAFANRSPIPSPTDFAPSRTGTGANDSGTGATAVLPDELRGFNWGAFLMSWIWSIAHNTWIGLLTLLFGIIMQVILGFKGNEWAWQNRKWDSIEHFRTVQRIWTRWGVGLLVLWLFLFFLILLPVFTRARDTARVQSGYNYTAPR